MSTDLDLGIAGRKAIICGSTKGLGKACAMALATAGVEVTINGRSNSNLEKAAGDIEKVRNAPIQSVAADVTKPEGRDALLAVCPSPDILITNAAGPPAGNFRDWSESDWIAALQMNMLAPIELIKATIGAMERRKWGRIINITSGTVKAPIALLGLSNGARSGLTGFIAGLAREVAKNGVTVNNMLPGPFDTERLRSIVDVTARRQGIDFEAAWRNTESGNPSGRVGRPEEFGAMCAFLCSNHAGFITGQNILLDGGAYPGTL